MSWNGVKKQSIKAEIEFWCEEVGIKKYTINSQGEIDVDGNVSLSGIRDFNFKKLPYKFGRVSGYFTLAHNKNIISLKNCPDEVGGYFDVDGCNKLDSLEGCPEEVGSKFFCRFCKCDFLKEEVMSLCKVHDEIITNGYNDYELY